jgi:hypothetical protein
VKCREVDRWSFDLTVPRGSHLHGILIAREGDRREGVTDSKRTGSLVRRICFISSIFSPNCFLQRQI